MQSLLFIGSLQGLELVKRTSGSGFYQLHFTCIVFETGVLLKSIEINYEKLKHVKNESGV